MPSRWEKIFISFGHVHIKDCAIYLEDAVRIFFMWIFYFWYERKPNYYWKNPRLTLTEQKIPWANSNVTLVLPFSTVSCGKGVTHVKLRIIMSTIAHFANAIWVGHVFSIRRRMFFFISWNWSHLLRVCGHLFSFSKWVHIYNAKISADCSATILLSFELSVCIRFGHKNMTINPKLCILLKVVNSKLQKKKKKHFQTEDQCNVFRS